jgi:GDP-4-dehydro-6-deoxy-D-mannose reductase
VQRPTIVTGAAGFAGSHLVELLASTGERVEAWFKPPAQEVPVTSGVTPRPVELLDRDAVFAAVKDVRPAAIYHCAGSPHVGSSWGDTYGALESNVLLTHYLLSAVRAFAPGASVFVPSSALVYAPSTGALDEDSPLVPRTPYGVSKLAQELLAIRAARDDGLRVLVARPFNHIGPRQDASFVASSFAWQIAEIEAGLRPPVLKTGNLESERDLTDVRDTVRAYRDIVERGTPGRLYNVCSGRAIRISELLNLLIGLSHATIDRQLDPARLRPADVPLLVGSAARIEHEIGWRSVIPLERTLADLLEFWRSKVGRERARQ